MLIGLIINNIYVNFKENSSVKAKFYLLQLKHVLNKYLKKLNSNLLLKQLN